VVHVPMSCGGVAGQAAASVGGGGAASPVVVQSHFPPASGFPAEHTQVVVPP